MKNLAWFLLFLFGNLTVIAGTPVAPIEVAVNQPDGSPLTVVPRGNYYVNWMETKDGFSVVRDQDGTWKYAEKTADGRLVPGPVVVGEASRAQLDGLVPHLRPDVDPSSFEEHNLRTIAADIGRGTVNQPIVVILVGFADQALTYDKDDFQPLMFGATNSVKDFYDDNSYGNFLLTAATESQGTVNDGIIEVSLGTNHPNSGNNGTLNRQLASDAMDAADAFIDYSSYDTNADGSISASELSIVVIAAGYENSFGGNSSLTPRVWGHKSSVSGQTNDAVSLGPYTIFGEQHATSLPSAHIATIGIMCHELGHLMLGLPDLYDRDSTSAGIGDWGLMASGSWNFVGSNSGDSPAHLSAWSKYTVGFLTPQVVETVENGVSFSPLDTNAFAKIIHLDKYRAGEYFLLSERAQSGYDAGLPGSGLMIWHIDQNVATQNDDETHKLVDLESADGDGDMDSFTNQGDTGDPFPGTSSNTLFNDVTNPNAKNYSNAATGTVVANIAAARARTADLTPATIDDGANIRYDELINTGGFGYNSTQAHSYLIVENNTGFDTLDGFQVLSRSDNVVIDFYLYESFNGSTLSNQLHSETGFNASSGWNRFLLASPQSFPDGTTRTIVLKFSGGSSLFPVAYSAADDDDSSYISFNLGSGFSNIPGDLNQVALLSSTCDAPGIDTQPLSQSVCPGENVTFSVVASGDGLTYQWKKGGVDLGGETSASLNLTGVGAGDAGDYTCVITGDCGDVTSDVATLTLDTVIQISQDPAPDSACPGGTASFFVTATGTSPSYQWRKDGVNMPGENSATLTLTDVDAGDEADYDCVVSNDCGSETSNTASFTLDAAPVVTVPPANETVCDGDDHTFTVTATGSGLSYQWRKDGANILGQTSASLSLTDIVTADAGLYDCVVSNLCGADTSIAATLTVNDVPIITEDPAGANECEGDDAVFSVVASGADLSYQWRKDNVDMPGETSATLTLTNITAADVANYSCRVTNPCGNVTSANAALTLANPTLITLQPTGDSLCEGENFSLIVAAGGDNLTYQWRQDGIDIPGATSATYSVVGAAPEDTGSYTCVVTGDCGDETSNAAGVIVGEQTLITNHPDSANICEGANLTLTVEADGSNLGYQWRKDNLDLPGETAATLSLVGAQASDAGDYTCFIEGDCGNEVSNIAEVNIGGDPLIVQQPEDKTVCLGNSVFFVVTASGDGLTYQWRKDNIEIPGETSATLSFGSVTADDAADYVCAVSSDCGGTLSAVATLTVEGDPVITLDPSGALLCEGEDHLMEVQAEGSNLTYQWRKDGVDLPGETASTLNLISVIAEDEGLYTCFVESSCGDSESDAAAVVIGEETAIVSQPVNLTRCEQSNATFSLVALGSNLSYQWRKDGGDLPGETGPNLTLTAVTAADEATYTCFVEGDCGSVTSDGVTLSVENGSFSVTVSPSWVTQGVDDILLISEVNCGVPGYSYLWQDRQLNTLGTDSTLLLVPRPASSLQITLTVTDSLNDSVQAEAFVLVHPNETDPDGDGNNDLDDLLFVIEDWRRTSPFDADGDGIVTVLDLMYFIY